jgi:hypothetical protein
MTAAILRNNRLRTAANGIGCTPDVSRMPLAGGTKRGFACLAFRPGNCLIWPVLFCCLEQGKLCIRFFARKVKQYPPRAHQFWMHNRARLQD